MLVHATNGEATLLSNIACTVVTDRDLPLRWSGVWNILLVTGLFPYMPCRVLVMGCHVSRQACNYVEALEAPNVSKQMYLLQRVYSLNMSLRWLQLCGYRQAVHLRIAQSSILEE